MDMKILTVWGKPYSFALSSTLIFFNANTSAVSRSTAEAKYEKNNHQMHKQIWKYWKSRNEREGIKKRGRGWGKNCSNTSKKQAAYISHPDKPSIYYFYQSVDLLYSSFY